MNYPFCGGTGSTKHEPKKVPEISVNLFLKEGIFRLGFTSGK
jgi:hypothetical protein